MSRSKNITRRYEHYEVEKSINTNAIKELKEMYIL